MQAISVSISGTAVRADGVTIGSDCAGDNAFTASELLAAALGSCLAASLAPLAARHEVDASAVGIVLLGAGESLEDGIAVRVRLPSCPDGFLPRCQRAAAACPVARALKIPLQIHWQVTDSKCVRP